MQMTIQLKHFTKGLSRLRSPLFSNGCRRNLSITNLFNAKAKLNEEDKLLQRNDVFFARIESAFYHRILENDPKYSKSVLTAAHFPTLLQSTLDSNFSLDRDLSNLSVDSVVPCTAIITQNLLQNKLNFSSPTVVQFASFVKKNAKQLHREDIPKLLSLIYLWPVTNKLMYPSISTIIFALDFACSASAAQLKSVPVEEVLLCMEPWHWMGLCTMSEFVQVATGKLFWRAEKMEHIVQLLFYMSELRTLPNHYDRPSIEKKVIKYMRHFNCNEVGILAAGFYKSSTKVTNYVLYKQLVKRIVNDTSKFDDIALNAVLKLLRATILTFKEEKDVIAMQKTLLPLVPSLSGMCTVQAAMLGTPMEIIDRDLMKSILTHLGKLRSELREKDFQRVMYCCAMGLIESEVKVFVEQVVDEVYRRELPTLHRIEDARKNPEVYTKLVSFLEIVLFLHILGYRSSELIASAIEIGNHIGVTPKQTVALHHLDLISDLLFPGYSGPRLDESTRQKHHQSEMTLHEIFLQFWFPGKSTLHPSVHWFAFEWRRTTPEMMRKLYLDVCDTCGGDKNVGCQTLLPLYEHKDIVVCSDRNGNFVPMPSEFGAEPNWKPKKPVISDDITFSVIMPLRDRSSSGLPDYTLYQKLRKTLLQNLGYRIAVVRYKVFEDIPKTERHACIRDAIKAAK